MNLRTVRCFESVSVAARASTSFVARHVAWFAVMSVFAIALLLGSRAGDFLANESNNLRQADLLVVLGGGWEARTTMGGALMRDGWAQRVLLTGMPKAHDRNGEPSNDPRYSYLRSLGVSSETILLDSSAKSTWEEAHVIRDLVKKNGWSSVLIVSDPPHFRRLGWVCERVLGVSNIDYRLIASRPRWWNPSLWWENKISASFVLKEFIKLFYYRVKYV